MDSFKAHAGARVHQLHRCPRSLPASRRFARASSTREVSRAVLRTWPSCSLLICMPRTFPAVSLNADQVGVAQLLEISCLPSTLA